MESLHHCLREMENNEWFPTILFPFTFEGSNNPDIVMVKVVDGKPISEFDANWFFPKLKVLTHLNKSFNARLYSSVSFKKLMLSIVKNVVTFKDKAFRPILDSKHMYIDADNKVVFTNYEKREAHHDWMFEASELSKFFKSIGLFKARGSATIYSELKAFGDWLITTNHSDLLGDANMVFRNVIFWNDRMRIEYIIELYDALESGRCLTYPDAEDAFADAENYKMSRPTTRNFRDIISNSKNAILIHAQMMADSDFLKKCDKFSNRHQTTYPSWRRSNLMGATPRIIGAPPQLRLEHLILEQGLTRLRDMYRHTFQLTNVHFPLEEVQHMYQYVFPIHMIAFAKLQNQIQFDAKSNVQSLGMLKEGDK
ncbi:uncharacterized protein LOC110686057 [Chenopodium quinoa]|uniref:uncharacterized protein LOC110686057 n=1 Tax=Chenopodium quinoa TaxID=63459 RepID=UPI000B7870B5|nr:uncharacterized protein LOC110686057 [Chenopodium quinoa]XP_021718322.1 uncharacterized protein LOC110686057 [Chenopodium quinoa]XP_021718323.1 uncharacterized protein LOC110686057 [Chenopodium quinoa]XP_021718324.1 uncharacterized protein LOC110686057 [Chenopodium quinoa]XP_021718326.1 uncharacterized protein LOC110686057 [Chenopodium quinoa]XP_021718327.1 uncharacterized protein LOC110686057 [Chenopodium quinoa]XP_021718328.1 uncharacterized protein LOC110686057 [Chenopodium quinoa]XP_0